jgi:hypothetical protein
VRGRGVAGSVAVGSDLVGTAGGDPAVSASHLPLGETPIKAGQRVHIHGRPIASSAMRN